MKKPGPFDDAIRELGQYTRNLFEFTQLKNGPSAKWKANCLRSIKRIRYAIKVLKAAGKVSPVIDTATGVIHGAVNSNDLLKAIHAAQKGADAKG